MGIKLFSKKNILKYNDLRTADPTRTPTDFSDPAYQEQANQAAGYEKAGKTDQSHNSTLVMDSDGTYNYRHQNGILWRKKK